MCVSTWRRLLTLIDRRLLYRATAAACARSGRVLRLLRAARPPVVLVMDGVIRLLRFIAIGRWWSFNVVRRFWKMEELWVVRTRLFYFSESKYGGMNEVLCVRCDCDNDWYFWSVTVDIILFETKKS